MILMSHPDAQRTPAASMMLLGEAKNRFRGLSRNDFIRISTDCQGRAVRLQKRDLQKGKAKRYQARLFLVQPRLIRFRTQCPDRAVDVDGASRQGQTVEGLDLVCDRDVVERNSA